MLPCQSSVATREKLVLPVKDRHLYWFYSHVKRLICLTIQFGT
jgi:hypothetical protein